MAIIVNSNILNESIQTHGQMPLFTDTALFQLHFYSHYVSPTSREPMAAIPFTYGLKNHKFEVFKRFIEAEFKWLPDLTDILKQQFELSRKTDGWLIGCR